MERIVGHGSDEGSDGEGDEGDLDDYTVSDSVFPKQVGHCPRSRV